MRKNRTTKRKNYVRHVYSILATLDMPHRRIFWGLCAGIVTMLLLYGYFLNMAIVNVVERRSAISEAANVTSRSASLEARYNTLQSKITYQYARNVGFYEPQKKYFAERTRLVARGD